MDNIISYVEKNQNCSFEQLPFNEVDALVLSQFIYMKLDGLVPHHEDRYRVEPLRLCHMAALMDEEKVFIDKRYEKDNRALLSAMLGSVRYVDMQMHFYSNIVSVAAETQFSAITIFLDNGPTVVVFRGTDESLVGWKEDFNMCFSEPVTGQELSARYLKQVGDELKGSFMIAGHSKGGNFAVYASMNVEEEIQNRIERVYSFDGPGFRPEILASVDFEKIKTRIHKYLPHSCLVGMLLQSQEPYRVVECSSVGFMQHNPYNWHIEDDHFKELEDVADSSKLFNETINQWLLGLDEEELHGFAEIWYEIAKSAHVKDLLEVAEAPGKTMHDLWEATRNLDEEKKQMGKKLITSLLQLSRENRKNAKKQERDSEKSASSKKLPIFLDRVKNQ
ncbi:MAG: Mbeg1-like protein [Lachnospiraceae bacterium]